MIHRVSNALAAVALIFVSACGGASTHSGSTVGNGSQGEDGSGAATGGGTGGECSWPASVNPPDDAGPWGWDVARYFLRCNDGPAIEVCMSNDPSTCPGTNAVVGGTISDCVDQCNADEYAVSAGGPPQSLPDGGFTFPATPNLPPACRSLGGNPAGVAYSCCPCE